MFHVETTYEGKRHYICQGEYDGPYLSQSFDSLELCKTKEEAEGFMEELKTKDYLENADKFAKCENWQIVKHNFEVVP